MVYCTRCGASASEEARFCPECGAPLSPAGAGPGREVPGGSVRQKKPLWRRWWVWVLALVLLSAVLGGRRSPSGQSSAPSRTAPAATAAPTYAPTAAPTAEPTPEPTPEPDADGVRPQVREFLDSYETFMDEYIDFMDRYLAAGPESMVSMMGEYYDILARYGEFAGKLEALDETDMNSAELAYYIEVTGRVNQKLLSSGIIG